MSYDSSRLERNVAELGEAQRQLGGRITEQRNELLPRIEALEALGSVIQGMQDVTKGGQANFAQFWEIFTKDSEALKALREKYQHEMASVMFTNLRLAERISDLEARRAR